MAYPSIANFAAPQPNAAWWIVARGVGAAATTPTLCETDGLTFARQVQATLRAAVPSAPSPEWRDWNNASPTGSTSFDVDGRWGPLTLRALYAYLRHFGASAPLLAGVQADATARRITAGSLLAGGWVLEHAARGGDFSITISQNTTPFSWAIEPPAPPGWYSAQTAACRPMPGRGDQTPAPAPAPPGPATDLDCEESYQLFLDGVALSGQAGAASRDLPREFAALYPGCAAWAAAQSSADEGGLAPAPDNGLTPAPRPGPATIPEPAPSTARKVLVPVAIGLGLVALVGVGALLLGAGAGGAAASASAKKKRRRRDRD
jgi:hypothetical protein